MKKVLYAIVIGFVIVLVWSLLGESGADDQYIESVKVHREEKERFFKTSEASPFVQKNVRYEPVSYFDPDPMYKVRAKMDRLTKREVVTIANSDGSSTKYLKFARLNFKLKGASHALIVLKPLGFGNQYFTAFADETSGETTYGGGRYLDLTIGKSDRVEIDFNKAYNPYCAYVGDFLCPLPPKENILRIAIEAGEKDYQSQ